MNRFVTAAVIGGAALAFGVLPAASQAMAATMPPTPITAMAATPTTSPTAPASPSAPSPGGHQSHGHRGGRAPGRHSPGSRTPSGHTGHAGSRRPSSHSPTNPGTGTPARHAPSRTPGAHAPSRHRPARHTPARHRTPTRRPGGHRTPTRPARPTNPTNRPAPAPKPAPAPRPAPAPKPAPKPTAAPVAQPRIFGGEEAGSAPWAAQVSWDRVGYQCSGTLVAPSWVLTARHCANKGGMSVQVGSPNLGEGTRVTVDSATIDPAGDLALLHLSRAVEEPTVGLADRDPKVGSINSILGWGKTSPDSGPSDVLKRARVRVTGVGCVDAFGGKAICSAGITGSAFNGDSGGPEMAGDVQVGVCSTGEPNGSQQYTSIAANRQWIREVANV